MPDSTILVVDDDPVIQKLLQVNFSIEGYQVELAGDGLEALEKAQAVLPDLIVLDVMMPRMNGLEAAKALKADPKTASIPIIMLSAKAQDMDQDAGKEAGVDLYMTKPFDPLDLLDRAAELIKGR
ncbi:MAG TPA: response regulator [Acidimicrobiales bacterium]|nr:response regulator [Acidimicrobiales bacterium]